MRRPACAMVWHTHSTAHDRKTYCSRVDNSTPGGAKNRKLVVASATGDTNRRATGTLNSVESRGATFHGKRRFPTPGAYLKRFNSAHSKSRSKIAQSVGCFTVRQQYRAGRLLQICPTPRDSELIVPTPFVPLPAQNTEVDTQSL